MNDLIATTRHVFPWIDQTMPAQTVMQDRKYFVSVISDICNRVYAHSKTGPRRMIPFAVHCKIPVDLSMKKHVTSSDGWAEIKSRLALELKTSLHEYGMYHCGGGNDVKGVVCSYMPDWLMWDAKLIPMQPSFIMAEYSNSIRRNRYNAESERGERVHGADEERSVQEYKMHLDSQFKGDANVKYYLVVSCYMQMMDIMLDKVESMEKGIKLD